MFRKLTVFIMLLALGSFAAFAQKAEKAEKAEKMEKAEKALAKTYELFYSGVGGSYLGVRTRNVSKENMANYGLSEVQGVAIEKVMDNSPASQAGLMNGDVIVGFNGEKITSVRKLTRLIREVAPDHTVRVEVLRNGVKRDFDVTLAKREMPNFSQGNFEFGEMPVLPEIPEVPNVKVLPPKVMREGVLAFGSNRRIGVSLTPLTKQLGEYFGVSEGKGVLIKSVREDSPAARAGLRAGDVIVEVEGKEINRSFDLIRAINAKKEGDVTLTIVRDRNRQIISVTPEKSEGGVFNFDGNVEGLFDEFPGNMRILVKPSKSPAPATKPAIIEETDN